VYDKPHPVNLRYVSNLDLLDALRNKNKSRYAVNSIIYNSETVS